MTWYSLGASALRELATRVRVDAFENLLTGLGGTRDRSLQTSVRVPRILAPQELEALYHGADLARKIVDKPVKAALRHGFEGDDAPAFERWKLSDVVAEAAIWGRLYGAGAVLIGTREGTLSDPLPDRLAPGSLQYLMPLERQHFSIESYDSDPLSRTYNQPLMYQVSRAAQGRWLGERVHASRLVMFYGVHTSEHYRQANSGFPLSVLQLIHEILADVDGSWRSTMLLLQDLSQAVFRLKGLADQIAGGGKDALIDRMEIVNMARGVARAVIVDADTEDFHHVGAANVTGVKDILTFAFQRLAAAADMPVTVLFGMSPAGMDATGESDIELWHERVSEYQRQISPAVLALARRIVESDGGEAIDSIEWRPLETASEEERATAAATRAATWRTYVETGVVVPEEVALIEFGGRPPSEVLDLETRDARLSEEPDDEATIVAPPGAPAAAEVQKTALTGVQLTSAGDTIMRYVRREISRQSAKALLLLGFPTLSDAEAERLLGPEDFAPPVAPAPPVTDGGS